MRLLVAAVLAAVLSGGSVSQEPRVPVLVELFTSEGCSSCPSADDLLRRLVQEQPVAGVEIIALSEHVDYWDHQGWKDPFSSSRFTARQDQYAPHFDGNGMYTPQAVVDGRFQMVGSDGPKLRDAILSAAKAPKALVQVRAHMAGSGRLAVTADVRDVPPDQRGDLDVMLAVIEHGLTVDVKRGENASRRLQHDAVVRTLDRIGTIARDTRASVLKGDPKVSSEWPRSNLRVVVFLQHRRSGHVIGAGISAID